ncbi:MULTISPECIES: methionine ABC transporter ATP-binding protein [unclassified Fusibacter]|uniref:methionine ABC transporter ATP-binding protein n=1 Tax=unclassified Fusibacter TaxID=2624464 RepID=UPI0010132B76|nr:MULTISPECIES: ATP-binding cassette domain-containing protein [unclassified Fusibacter]MCK8058173.1 ATP-binding cassette domain-containing protein [Fusibacter sp. A2]NPE20756.1 ATP-binding cassette domain-containing protein [Fusibacter sp. A1]RXV62963.1 ATP-binding cassette domain-containing protein [Fusibacter sp. A1]
MITVNRVSKEYRTIHQKVQAVKDVTLTIEKGEIFGIIGLSGAGKSTLIRLINGLEGSDSGSIGVDDVIINELTESQLNGKRKEIGMIFQHFNLLSSRDVLENVMFPLEIDGMKRDAAKRKAIELLERVGLGDKVQARISQLSGGQKQRVAIARALVNQPKVLLCDEATSALDPKTTLEILALLKELRDQFGLTIMLITHQMEVIESICDKVAFMENGSINHIESLNKGTKENERLKIITDDFFKIKAS